MTLGMDVGTAVDLDETGTIEETICIRTAGGASAIVLTTLTIIGGDDTLRIAET
jgi:hypothetical protein